MPTVTLPSPSTRTHSCDFMSFRSPGIPLMALPAAGSWNGRTVYWRPGSCGCAGGEESAFDPGCGPAVLDEERRDHADRDLLAADVDAHALCARAVPVGRDPGQRDRLGNGGRERAGEDRALTRGREHFLPVAKYAALIHHQRDQLPRDAGRLLLLQCAATDEVAPLVKRHGPAEPGFVGSDGLVHVLAVQVEARLQPQGIARPQARRLDARVEQRLPQRWRLLRLEHDLETVFAGVAGAGNEQPGTRAAADFRRGKPPEFTQHPAVVAVHQR